jgi:hypothetical protein
MPSRLPSSRLHASSRPRGRHRSSRSRRRAGGTWRGHVAVRVGDHDAVAPEQRRPGHLADEDRLARSCGPADEEVQSRRRWASAGPRRLTSRREGRGARLPSGPWPSSAGRRWCARGGAPRRAPQGSASGALFRDSSRGPASWATEARRLSSKTNQSCSSSRWRR